LNKLILSIFPGIDLLGKGFEEQGFCIVRSPDLITGGDIRNFFPPSNCFKGVIGGSPCQDFSALNRNPRTYSYEMLEEYCRVVIQSQPDWFLFENVANAPSFNIGGYTQQRFELDLGWFSEFSRLRHFVFGSRNGQLLNPMKGILKDIQGTAVTGTDSRSFKACCEIQGLPVDFDLPFFTLEGKKQAVANGVPLQLSRYVAQLIVSDYYSEKPKEQKENDKRRCNCGCGRVVVGKAKSHSPSCRKRIERAKKKRKDFFNELKTQLP